METTTSAGQETTTAVEYELGARCSSEMGDNSIASNGVASALAVQLAHRPKRPLTAYNIFFREQRCKILREIPHGKEGSKKGSISSIRTRRHGKIGFAELARSVSAKWQATTQEERRVFEEIAVIDRIRYDREMKVWRQSNQDQEEESRQDLVSSSSAEEKLTGDTSTTPLANEGSDEKVGISQMNSGTVSSPVATFKTVTPMPSPSDHPPGLDLDETDTFSLDKFSFEPHPGATPFEPHPTAPSTGFLGVSPMDAVNHTIRTLKMNNDTKGLVDLTAFLLKSAIELMGHGTACQPDSDHPRSTTQEEEGCVNWNELSSMNIESHPSSGEVFLSESQPTNPGTRALSREIRVPESPKKSSEEDYLVPSTTPNATSSCAWLACRLGDECVSELIDMFL